MPTTMVTAYEHEDDMQVRERKLQSEKDRDMRDHPLHTHGAWPAWA